MSKDENESVFLDGFLNVPANRLDAVRAALPQHIALMRAERGCISFEVTEDVNQPGRFNVSEIFEDRSAFDAHQSRTKASDWFAVTKGIPREYSVTFGDEAAR